jgi:cell division inhibitor SepF
MVYLGLQDDDELDYSGEYESYGEYGDVSDAPQNPRSGRGPNDAAHDRDPAARESGAVRTAREAPPEYGEYGAAEPAPPRAVAREEPSGMSAPRPSVVRTIGPTSAARVHVVEPQGFNDAQEVGDRLKASQPVILNLQGLPRELQRRLIDFSSGLAYAVAGSMQRVADQVFLLTPTNVEVSQEEKDRLQARGLFQP